MAIQFTPLAFGVMLVVAVGTLAYTLWNTNSNRDSRHSYSHSSTSSSFDYGYDTYKCEAEERKRKKKTEDICSICLDIMKSNLQTLSCKHMFHKHCITMWLNTNNTCPICRTNNNTQ